MLSRQIDLAALEVRDHETAKENRRADDYKEKTRGKSLNDELKRSSLKALKRLLADAKANSDSAHAMSAAGPFSSMSITQVNAHKAEALKIDPSAQAMQLYNKLIDKLIFVAKEDIKKTTFYLNTTAFDSSVLRGARITITEYSFAPRIFNIQFSADPKAVAFFELHAQDLQSALNNGNHKFNINRIDTSLHTEDEKHATSPVKRDPEEQDDA